VLPCDVTSDADMDTVFATIEREWGGLDFVVHGAAFAGKDELSGAFVNTSRQGFLTAMDISAYSLVALARRALPLMERRGGGSLVTLTYLGSERAFPNYNVMVVAKAALESIPTMSLHGIKIGVAVVLNGGNADVARDVAMHVAAASPLALTQAHLDKALIEREYNVQKDIALQSGKPEAVVEKMMEGRMRKYYEEVVLMQQVYMLDGETPIAKLLEKASKDLGAPVEIEGFVRFKVGEGIEKVQGDFADEVAQMAGGR